MGEVTVATLNLYNRAGNWDARAPLVVEQLAALAPDVIGLQEVDLMLDQGMQVSREVNKRLAKDVPHYRIKHAAMPGVLASIHGIATLAGLPFQEHEILDLMTFDRIAQRMVFPAGERPFVLVNTHLHHPPEATAERLAQAEYLLAWLDRHDPLPTVVLGDFNAYAAPPEDTVKFLKARFRSAYEAVHGREPEKTWSTPVNTDDKSPHGTLDYIFVSPEFEIVDARLAFDRPAADDSNLYPSDHLGVWARLRL